MEKQKLANYYKDLPQGFTENYCIDAKKFRVAVVINILGAFMMLAAGVVLFLAKFGINGFPEIGEESTLSTIIALLIVVVGYIVYIIAHELTHGACYKLLTKQKLTFGMTLTVAFCGLKEGYVNKKTALISVLAPFVVHSLWMLPVVFLVPNPMIVSAFIVLFAFHFGGCIGDLWVTSVLLFKYSGKNVLMCDNGPRQKFYVYSDAVEAQTPVAEEIPQAEEE